jgi:hypothetical protein
MVDGDLELYPITVPGDDFTPPGTGSYASGMWLWDNTYSYWSSGHVWLDLPQLADGNSNRFPDFLEVSRAVANAQSPGSYDYTDAQTFDYYTGNIVARWNRAAGSKNGTCTFAFSDPYWGTFSGTFEILEYTGSLAYTPATNIVNGTLTLSQTGSNNTFQGSVQFIKSDTNHFNSLIIQPGTLTDGVSTAYYFTNHYFFRDASWPTNYAGLVEFDDDGNQGSFHPYALWALSINDPNDANHDGIPDFSDDPAPALPRRPQLALTRGTTNLILTISGDVGHVHQVWETPSLTSPSWHSILSVTLTNDPQPVSVPRPVGPGYKFWRVQAQ